MSLGSTTKSTISIVFDPLEVMLAMSDYLGLHATGLMKGRKVSGISQIPSGSGVGNGGFRVTLEEDKEHG